MKEKLPFFVGDEHWLLGVERQDLGAIVETRYYFHGWIDIGEISEGYQPEYVHGYTGKETVIRVRSIKPVAKISVIP
jgi:hypothetical protein